MVHPAGSAGSEGPVDTSTPGGEKTSGGPRGAAVPGRTDEAIEAALAELLTGEADDLERQLQTLLAAQPSWRSELERRVANLRALGLWPASAAVLGNGPLGDFEPIEVIGSGGMGIVYRARQLSLGREVALKVVRPEYLLFPGSRERFRREADVIARLKHPGIVPVYAYGEVGGVPHFAMELVEGLSLAELLGAWKGRSPAALHGRDLEALLPARQRSPSADAQARLGLPWWRLALELARDVALALEHAHASGVIHRDIKPSNILVTTEGRARLLDFGLTSTASGEPITRTGSQPGTLPYMSPEQLHGETLDGRSDLYSLGVALYELLSLRRPFDSPTSLGLQAQIEAGAAPRLLHLCPHLPRAVGDVVSVAMDYRRERRYQGAAALAEDLTRALDGRPLLARPPGPLGRAIGYARRHPARAIALGSALALVSVLPTGLYLQSQSHGRELAQSLANERAARADAQALAAELNTRSEALALALERETGALVAAEAALADAETALAFLCNLVLEGAPERLQGEPFSLDRLLRRALDGAHNLADRPGVHSRFLLCLGDVFLSLNNWSEAESALRQALEIERRVSGRNSAWSLRTLNSLATALQRQGRVHEALPLFEEALNGQRELRGELHLGTAAAHNNLASAALSAGEFARAIEHFGAAARSYAEIEPAEPLYSAIARANLTYTLARAGQTDRIPAALADAEAELARAEGAEPLLLARAQNLIASIWLDQGEPARALVLLEAANATFAATLPGPDLHWAAARFNRGSARLALQDANAALPDLEAAVAQSEALGQSDHPDGQRYRAKLTTCRTALALER